MSKRTSVLRAAQRARKESKSFLEERRVTSLDSFQNFSARLGINAGSQLDESTYGFNPITRNRTLLEWMHRGSWIAGLAVDIVADDMTRAGVTIKGIEPEDATRIHELATIVGLWKCLNRGIKWGRLYGGAIGVLLIDGQNVEKPLRIETVGPEQFKGILILDRWQVEPSLNELIEDLGPNLGLPKYYKVMRTAPALRGKRAHHTRCIRFNGIELPYQQMLIENMWSLSILERLYDRMVSYDSATMGAAQLVFKSYLRSIKVDGLRSIVSQGGRPLEGLVKYVEFMRMFQSIEGMTMLDKEDEFAENTGASTSMAGVEKILAMLGEQLSGATQIPLVRFFGQEPAGMNATGENDLITYYDNINKGQEDYRVPITACYRALAASLGIKIKPGFGITFNPLWQLKQTDKAEVSGKIADSISTAYESDLITQKSAMKELKNIAETTGIFGNITDEEIESAEDELLSSQPSPQPPVASPGSLRPRMEGQPSAPGSGGGGPTRPRTARRPADSYSVSSTLSNISAFALMHDLHIAVETPHGERRSANWGVPQPADYGYIRGHIGEDGDQIDCFVSSNVNSDVYVIDQLINETFDEHKVMLGFDSEVDAVFAYQQAYEMSNTRMGKVRRYTMNEFKRWLNERKTTDRAAGENSETTIPRSAPGPAREKNLCQT